MRKYDSIMVFFLLLTIVFLLYMSHLMTQRIDQLRIRVEQVEEEMQSEMSFEEVFENVDRLIDRMEQDID